MEKMKVGVIGCGQIAQIMHLPYIQELDMLELYSLCDLSKLVVEKLGKKYNIPKDRQFIDMDEMLKDPALEAVVICTKDHYEPGLKAAKAGKHLFIEKPLAYSLAQADEILAAAKASKVTLQVGYMKRYDPGFEYALEKIKKLKDINFVRVHDYGGSFDFTGKIYDLYSGTDIPKEIIEQGNKEMMAAKINQIGEERAHLVGAYDLICGLSSHDTILMRHAFGYPKVLFADVHKVGFVTAVLAYDDFRVSFESGLVMDRRNWDETIDVYANSCHISVKFPWPYLKNAPTIVHVNENEPDSMVNVQKQVTASFDESYKKEWLHFYDCVRNGKMPYTSGEDARKDLALANDIIRAVKI